MPGLAIIIAVKNEIVKSFSGIINLETARNRKS